MGKLIAVVGNTGVGKTTLVQCLCSKGNFVNGLEGHLERPYQALFKNDRSYAIANQVDYLLLRAEQERLIRQQPLIGIQDGGLDMDFHIFSRLFKKKGYLSNEDFSLCERLYRQIRFGLPPPELIIWLDAPLESIKARYARRQRPLEIAGLEDLADIQVLLEEWLIPARPDRLVRLEASEEDPTYENLLPDLIERIENLQV